MTITATSSARTATIPAISAALLKSKAGTGLGWFLGGVLSLIVVVHRHPIATPSQLTVKTRQSAAVSWLALTAG